MLTSKRISIVIIAQIIGFQYFDLNAMERQPRTIWEKIRTQLGFSLEKVGLEKYLDIAKRKALEEHTLERATGKRGKSPFRFETRLDELNYSRLIYSGEEETVVNGKPKRIYNNKNQLFIGDKEYIFSKDFKDFGEKIGYNTPGSNFYEGSHSKNAEIYIQPSDKALVFAFTNIIKELKKDENKSLAKKVAFVAMRPSPEPYNSNISLMAEVLPRIVVGLKSDNPDDKNQNYRDVENVIKKVLEPAMNVTAVQMIEQREGTLASSGYQPRYSIAFSDVDEKLPANLFFYSINGSGDYQKKYTSGSFWNRLRKEVRGYKIAESE